MNHKALQKKVEQALTLNGWAWCAYDRAQVAPGVWKTPVHGRPGLHDVIAVRPPRLMFVEIKVGKDKQSPDQKAWHDELAKSGVEAYVIRPEDYDDFTERIKRPRASVTYR